MNCNIQKKKGKILGQFTLNAYSDEPELPDISPDDAGKFLGINTQGEIKAKDIPIPETKKYYRHRISINDATYGYISFIIINDNSTAFTRRSLAQWLYDNGFTSRQHEYPTPAVGSYTLSSNTAISGISGVWVSSAPTTDTPTIHVYGHKKTFTIVDGAIKINNDEINTFENFTLMSDDVTEI